MGLIKRNFKYLDENTFILLYYSLVRSQLEYASSVWFPYRKGLINEIENIQRRATEFIPKLKNLPYQTFKALKITNISLQKIQRRHDRDFQNNNK